MAYKQNEIGQIPDEWNISKLYDLVEIKQGFASGKRDDDGIIQLRMNNISPDGKVILDSFIKVPVPHDIDDYLLQNRDILFNNTNSVDLVGKTAIITNNFVYLTYSNHLTRIRVKDKRIIPEWIFLHLMVKFQQGYFRSISLRYVGQSEVRTNDLLHIGIPIASIQEQKYIISLISLIDNAVEKTVQVMEKTRILKKGAMGSLFTRGTTRKRSVEVSEKLLPNGWKTVKLGEVSTIGTGSTPSTMTKEYYSGNIPFIRTAEIVNNVIKSASLFVSEKAMSDYSLKIYPVKTIFLAMYGQGKTRGQVALLGIPATTSQNTAAITTFGKVLDPVYLWHFLQHAYADLRAIGMIGHISHLDLTTVKNLNIPIPPLSEQLRIASILSAIHDKIELETKHKRYLITIRKRLVSDLIAGKKRIPGSANK